MDNDELRKRIASIDERIILLVADRMQAAHEIGQNKKAAGIPVYDPEVERTVIARYRRIAVEEHLDPDSAEELAKILMAWSCRIQE